VGRHSSVGIVTGYGLDGPESYLGACDILRTRPKQTCNAPSILYKRQRFFPGLKRSMGCFDHPTRITPMLKKD